MQKFKFIYEVAITLTVLISGIMVLLFGLGLYVSEVTVDSSFWVSTAFVVTAIAALDPIVKAERVLKGLLIVAMITVAGYLYLDYYLDDLFERGVDISAGGNDAYGHIEPAYDIYIDAEKSEALCRWHISE